MGKLRTPTTTVAIALKMRTEGAGIRAMRHNHKNFSLLKLSLYTVLDSKFRVTKLVELTRIEFTFK